MCASVYVWFDQNTLKREENFFKKKISSFAKDGQ